MNLNALRDYIAGFNTIICHDSGTFLKAAKACIAAGIEPGYDPELYAEKCISSEGTWLISLGGYDDEHLHFACRMNQAYYPNNSFIDGEDLETVFSDESEYDETCFPDISELLGGAE